MDQRLRTARPTRGGRYGYTLLEILVATTLSLLLMYGVAAVFSQVGSLMSQTQNVMGMSGSLRSARDRLAEDLSLLTVPKLKAPTSRNGFFCYTEGLGADDQRIITANQDLAATPPADSRPIYIPRTSMQNTEEEGFDTTVGDTDDILSFTLRAKEGEWFRGRFPVVDNSKVPPIRERIIESEFAEVIWFVRGTTLYRRVLLIVPDDVLQQSLDAMMDPARGNCPDNVRQGYGFFKYYDVSVHLDKPHDPDAKIVANTVADLANRKNRYGYWSSPVLPLPRPSDDPVSYHKGLYDLRHGAGIDENNGGVYYGAWYWLRLPTLQESASVPATARTNATGYFRAGVPFGNDNDWLTLPSAELPGDDNRWDGAYQRLSGSLDSRELPTENPGVDFDINDYFEPFIDLWNEPNFWNEVNPDTGDLAFASSDTNGSCSEILDQDVLLTNVLSFDVKAWDDAAGMYVDLGNRGRRIDLNTTVQTYSNLVRASIADEMLDEANRFDDFGRYKFNAGFQYPSYGFKEGESTAVQLSTNILRTPFLPAVFDTWTEEYEQEHLNHTYTDALGTYDCISRRNGFSPSDIPLDSEVTSAMLPDYPPPYDKELKAISIELRVFDPVSRTIKNTTLNIDLTKR